MHVTEVSHAAKYGREQKNHQNIDQYQHVLELRPVGHGL